VVVRKYFGIINLYSVCAMVMEPTNSRQRLRVSYLIHSMRATCICLVQTCGYPQGGAFIRAYYKTF
jgi:hypothetical protein